MTVIHAKDPTTQFLSRIYSQREDVRRIITEINTTSELKRAIHDDDSIMMFGHGNEYGLFSKPDKKGRVRRLLIKSEFVYLLREKTCIGIWCKANEFAKQYNLHGLFSGMIISELEEASLFAIPTTIEELNCENAKFAQNLKYCLETFSLNEVPARMKELDDTKSPLTTFNYNNLYYFP